MLFDAVVDPPRVRVALPEIVARAKAIRNMIVEPTLDERAAVRSAIFEFIRKRNRVVYGGTALNAHLLLRSPEKAIYDPDASDSPDIEFYSPRAMDDIVELCDSLFKAGHRHVEAKLAMHDDTYSIHVNMQKYCDVTYMSKNLYDVLPVSRMDDGIQYVYPHFTAIDYLRVLNDPLTCNFRFEKDFERLVVLDQCFPLAHPTKVFPRGHYEDIDPVLYEFARGRSTIAMIGRFAYEWFAKQAGETPVPHMYTHPAPIFECISVDFRNDAAALHELLKARKLGCEIKYVEHHRFYDFRGNTGVFYVNDFPVACIIDYNHRSIPTLGWNEAGVQMATFSYLLMSCMIAMTWHTAIGSHDDYAGMYQLMARHLVHFRRAFLHSRGLSILDPTPFRDFAMDHIIGKGKTAMRVKVMRNKQRERRGRPLVLKYRAGTAKDHLADFRFDNTSGKVINNPRDCMYAPKVKISAPKQEHGAAGCVEGVAEGLLPGDDTGRPDDSDAREVHDA